MRSALPKDQEPLLVDLRTAAKMLGLSEKTVWSMARNKRLPSLKAGPGRSSRRMYSVEALKTWVATNIEAQAT